MSISIRIRRRPPTGSVEGTCSDQGVVIPSASLPDVSLTRLRPAGRSSTGKTVPVPRDESVADRGKPRERWRGHHPTREPQAGGRLMAKDGGDSEVTTVLVVCRDEPDPLGCLVGGQADGVEVAPLVRRGHREGGEVASQPIDRACAKPTIAVEDQKGSRAGFWRVDRRHSTDATPQMRRFIVGRAISLPILCVTAPRGAMIHHKTQQLRVFVTSG